MLLLLFVLFTVAGILPFACRQTCWHNNRHERGDDSSADSVQVVPSIGALLSLFGGPVGYFWGIFAFVFDLKPIFERFERSDHAAGA